VSDAGGDPADAERGADAAPPHPFSSPLVPVANDEDAVATAAAVLPHVAAAGGRIVLVNVIEKAGGAPDKASVEQREALAAEAFAAFEERAAEAGVAVEDRLLYATDVADAVVEAAHEAGASAVVFTPRRHHGLLDFLAPDVRGRLIEESDLPVVVLPDAADADGASGDDGGADADGSADVDADADADADGTGTGAGDADAGVESDGAGADAAESGDAGRDVEGEGS
jgi:nucleotide-binding universal stress UspA family protein